MRVGPMCRCAAVWTVNATADANSPVITTAHHTETVGATWDSPTTVQNPESTAAIHSCTAASAPGLNLGAYRASSTICTAKQTAAMSTKASPFRTCRSFVSDSSARPITASTTPMVGPIPGRRRRNAAANSGVNTTNNPVTKPAFDARVYCRPTVCPAYATNSMSPASDAAIQPAQPRSRIPRQNSADVTSAASVNRSARNSNGGTFSIASFTTGNVTPQIAVTPISASA